MKIILSIFLGFIVAANGASPRVIGGKDAPDGKYPYMVSLRDGNFHFCGGSIINERWILTAAHCLRNREHKSVKVVAGTNLLRGGNEQIYKSEYVVVSPDHNTPSLYSNDVGLIRVNKDIVFNDKVQPVKLPKNDVSKAGLPAVVSGWGSTKLWGESPNKLQEISLKIFDQDACKKKMSHLTEINLSHICTFTQRGQGVCHGDSGSPLVVDGVQVGIASFVEPCAVGYPDVWGRVYTFLDWIASEQAKFLSQ